jgi:hypothetical protein
MKHEYEAKMGRIALRGIKLTHVLSCCVAFVIVALAAPGCGNGTQKCDTRLPSDSCVARSPTVDDCLEADGCSVGQSCQLINCPSLTTASSCSAVPTCNWQGTSCAYGGNPCQLLPQAGCTSQAGCVWTTGCVGQMKSCVGLDATACQAIPHCYMETVPDF